MSRRSGDERARAIARGVASAFTRQAKTAQYRGAPGKVPYVEAPPSPDWRLPLGNMCLTVEDYQIILDEAKGWYENSRLSYVRKMAGSDEDMVRRIALDYAIHSASGYKYAGHIDAPTYNKLLKILDRIL